MEDIGFQIGDLIALGVPGGNAQNTEGFFIHRSQHLPAVQAGDHPVQLVILKGDLRAVLQNLGALGHPVKEHPVGVEGEGHAGDIQLGGGHQGCYRSIHLKGVFQILTGDPDGHQGVSGYAVHPDPQRGDIEHIRRRQFSHRQGLPDDAGSGEGNVHWHPVLALCLPYRPAVGIGDEVAQGRLPVLGIQVVYTVKGIGIVHQDLVEG